MGETVPSPPICRMSNLPTQLQPPVLVGPRRPRPVRQRAARAGHQPRPAAMKMAGASGPCRNSVDPTGQSARWITSSTRRSVSTPAPSSTGGSCSKSQRHCPAWIPCCRRSTYPTSTRSSSASDPAASILKAEQVAEKQAEYGGLSGKASLLGCAEAISEGWSGMLRTDRIARPRGVIDGTVCRIIPTKRKGAKILSTRPAPRCLLQSCESGGRRSAQRRGHYSESLRGGLSPSVSKACHHRT